MISIILNAHNEGPHLQKTVDSILAAANETPFEIIFIDDGSDDDGFAFLSEPEYAENCHLTDIYRFEHSVGLIRARHQGIRLAQGDYVFILDAHMCVHDRFLDIMLATALRRGPKSIIMPALTGLDAETWAAHAPYETYITIDAKFDFEWRSLHYPSRLLATVSGGCYMMRRDFYFEIGGFDIGLRRWGCENIDIVLKAYAAGGVCFFEERVLIGHLFRTDFPYEHKWWQLHYNKLRVAYIHLPPASFRLFVDGLYGLTGFDKAYARFKKALPELRQLRIEQRLRLRRPEDWFVRTFLPQLWQKEAHECQDPGPLPLKIHRRVGAKISILMAALESPEAVEAAIADLLSHTEYDDFELLVLSSQSQGHDYAFLESERFGFLPELRHYRIPGPANRANLYHHGAQLAVGTLLKFVDGHSRFTPYWLTNLYDGWRRHGGIVGALCTDFDPESSRLGEALVYGAEFCAQTQSFRSLEEEAVGPNGRVPALFTAQMLIEKANYLKWGGFYGGGFEDQLEGAIFCAQATQRGETIHLIPEALMARQPSADPRSAAERVADQLLLTHICVGPKKAGELERIYARRGQDTSFYHLQIFALTRRLKN